MRFGCLRIFALALLLAHSVTSLLVTGHSHLAQRADGTASQSTSAFEVRHGATHPAERPRSPDDRCTVCQYHAQPAVLVPGTVAVCGLTCTDESIVPRMAIDASPAFSLSFARAPPYLG
jgi:hypothetical protein